MFAATGIAAGINAAHHEVFHSLTEKADKTVRHASGKEEAAAGSHAMHRFPDRVFRLAFQEVHRLFGFVAVLIMLGDAESVEGGQMQVDLPGTLELTHERQILAGRDH